MCQIDIVGFKPLVLVFKRRVSAFLSFEFWVKGLRVAGESFFLGWLSSGRAVWALREACGWFSCVARVRLVLAGPLPTLRVGALVRVLGRAGRELGARFVPRTNRKRAPQTARPLHPAPAHFLRQEP